MMMGSCGKTISRHPQQIRKKAELCDLTTLDRPPNQPSSGEEWMLPLANGRPTNGQHWESGTGGSHRAPTFEVPWLAWLQQQGSYPAVTSTCVANPEDHLRSRKINSRMTSLRNAQSRRQQHGRSISSSDCMMWGSEQQFNHASVGCSGGPACPASYDCRHEGLLALRPTSFERTL